MKKCTKCGENKSLSQFVKFPQRGPGKYHSHCRKCKITAAVVWQEKNCEYRKKYQAAHYKKNKKAVQKRHRKWNLENEAYLKDYFSRYYFEHKSDFRMRDKKYRIKNPGVVAARKATRRARELGIQGKYTDFDIQFARFMRYDKCFYCGIKGKLTVDHFIPLARFEHNPTNWPSNIVLAHPVCNFKKGAKLFSEWMLTKSYKEIPLSNHVKGTPA